jgi:thioredoxin reductase/bacterioferritin-associated ferredoxin
MMAMETELLVVGAGPAGLVAAAEAARRGIETMLVDEHRGTGGMLGVLGTVPLAAEAGARPASEVRRALHADAERAGVTVVDQSLVWGIFEDLLAGVLTPAENLEIKPRALIVAAGAADRPMPFHGWTLPYVLNAQEALRLVYEQDALPGRTAVVASAGGAGVPVALALHAAGLRVKALVESAALRDDEREALGAVGITAHEGARVTEAQGTDYVRAVVARGPGAREDRIVEANTLVLATGRAPLIELFAVTGCALRWDEAAGGHVPERSPHLETSVAGLYAIGASAGVCGLRVAAAEGRVAAEAAAARMERAQPGVLEAAMEDLAAARAAEREAVARETAALWQLETDAVRAALGAPEMLLCRCENVAVQRIREAIEDGAESPGEVKRATRMGMGECQGKTCRPLLSRAVAEITGGRLAAIPPLTFRPPVRPVPMDALLRGRE